MPRRSKNADPPSRLHGKQAVQHEEKKLTWFQRNIMCMTLAIHKENHEAYKERREMKKMLTRLQDNVGIVVTPPLEPAAAESSHTISYDKCKCDEFPWGDFSEVTSAPSSSRSWCDRSHT